MSVEIFGNIIAPTIASLFFLLYLLIFIFTSFQKALSYKYFIVFLFSFSIFLIGRPIQILLGPHPLPLIINNIRGMLICAVVVPSVLISGSSNEHSFFYRKRKLLILFGIAAGALLSLCNTMGTVDSYVLFTFGPITAYDCLSPSLTPPFFGREVTIGLYLLAGLILSTRAIVKISTLGREEPFLISVRKNKVFHFNFGILLFGASLIVGVLLRKWWIYYFVSIFSVVFMGYGILLDIKELSAKMSKVIPFIKEDLIQNITLSTVSDDELEEMLSILGKKNSLDTFLIFSYPKRENENDNRGIVFHQNRQEFIEQIVRQELGEQAAVVMSLGTNKVGVCIAAKTLFGEKREQVLQFGESIIKESKLKLGMKLVGGIGRTYSSLKDLGITYKEAQFALDYALNIGDNHVVHIDNVQESSLSSQYPYREKENLIFAVKLADRQSASGLIDEMMPRLREVVSSDFILFRIRVAELAGTIAHTAFSAGGDEKKLIDLSKNYFQEITTLKEIKEIEKWLIDFVDENITIITDSQTKRDKSIITKAKTFIEKQYQEHLKVEDVAKSVFLSPSYFKQLFKKETGLSFTDFLMDVRIKKAKELLVSTEKNITEIAFDTGYHDSNYFSTVFKQTVGESPTAFRKRITKESPLKQTI
jgi:two-component system, response regulator YesN